jgi:hypothetical protein
VEFTRLRHEARRNGVGDPFSTDAPVHGSCADS